MKTGVAYGKYGGFQKSETEFRNDMNKFDQKKL